jgi:hypothetical protein
MTARTKKSAPQTFAERVQRQIAEMTIENSGCYCRTILGVMRLNSSRYAI